MEHENNIDWSKIFNAYRYYEYCGFKNLNVDWTVPSEYVDVTKDSSIKGFFVDGLELIGSAEQAFIKMIDNQELEGDTRYMALSPCFRDEQILDKLHRQYFMKLELIVLFESHFSQLALHDIIDICVKFFKQYLHVDVIQTGEFQYDIVELKTGIELGSYGIRKWKNHTWIYATGIAEPRLSSVIEIAHNE